MHSALENAHAPNFSRQDNVDSVEKRAFLRLCSSAETAEKIQTDLALGLLSCSCLHVDVLAFVRHATVSPAPEAFFPLWSPLFQRTHAGLADSCAGKTSPPGA